MALEAQGHPVKVMPEVEAAEEFFSPFLPAAVVGLMLVVVTGLDLRADRAAAAKNQALVDYL